MKTTSSGSLAVYTAVVGGYESPQVPLDVATLDGVPAFRFTDSILPPIQGWTDVLISRSCFGDPIRDARAIKILGHQKLAAFSSTLWLDNRVQILCSPHYLLHELGMDRAQLAAPLHSYNPTVESEFDAVISGRFDDPRRVREQRKIYSELDPSVMRRSNYWTAILYRKQCVEVTQFNELWWQHVLRFSRRDQLSFEFCSRTTGLPVHGAPLDNFGSSYHVWREASAVERKLSAGRWYLESITAELSDLQFELRRRFSASIRPETKRMWKHGRSGGV